MNHQPVFRSLFTPWPQSDHQWLCLSLAYYVSTMADPNPSPLEQEVLAEYALLLANLNKVRFYTPAVLCLAKIVLVFRPLADRHFS